MSNDDPSDAQPDFAAGFLPAFDAGKALLSLKRELRALTPLTERGEGFEMTGKPVVMLALSATGDAVEGRVARRAESRPEWDKSVIRSGADQRKFVESIKQKLRRWRDED